MMVNAIKKINNDECEVIKFLQIENKKNAIQPSSGNKKKGVKSEVYAFEIEDLKKITTYFIDNKKWLHYLVFTLECNLARRIGDILSLTWESFYNSQTGEFRTELKDMVEQKTGKIANPRLNSAVIGAIQLYIEKTGCNPAKENYTLPITVQLSGTHRGKCLSYDAHRKAIKAAAKAVGIEYNVGTHSSRKTFGAMSKMLHPDDPNNMEILQSMFNHSSTAITNRYIGITRKSINSYYDDMGTFFNDYILGDKEVSEGNNTIMAHIDMNTLRDIVNMAYQAGMNNANESDLKIHIESINEIMTMVDECSTVRNITMGQLGKR